MSLNNFGIVKKSSTGAIYRGSQPDAAGFESLRLLGVDTIYKLNKVNDYTYFNAFWTEEDAYSGLFRNSLDRVITTSTRINDLYLKGRKTYVHCCHGRDRTGLVIGAWQILYDNHSFAEVLKERESYGCNWFYNLVDYSDIMVLKAIYYKKKLKLLS